MTDSDSKPRFTVTDDGKLVENVEKEDDFEEDLTFEFTE